MYYCFHTDNKASPVKDAMRIMIKILLSIVVGISLSITVANATEYYIAKNGDNGNPGTEAQPWLTIQKAANTAVAGDTVYIKAGTYTEMVNFPNSGTSGHYITFQNYQTDNVIVDGNGNAGYLGVLSIQNKSYIKIIGLKVTHAVWGVWLHGSSADVSYIELTNMNVYNTTDDPVELAADGHSVHHVTISGCTIYDGVLGISPTVGSGSARPHDITITGCTFHDLYGGVGSERADYLTVYSNIAYSCTMGYDIGSGVYNVIHDNVAYTGENGIDISSNSHSLIYNNTVHDLTGECFYNYYFSVHGEPHTDNHFYNNICYNAAFGVFESNQKSDGSAGISTNHIYYNNLFYNISGGYGHGTGAFLFQGTSGLQFYNNTVYLNAGYNGLMFYGNGGQESSGHIVANNIIDYSGNYVPIIEDSGSLSGSTVDYNDYYNRNGSSTGPGAHSVIGDPKFVDSANKNFRLKAGSPCIDAGSSDSNIPVTDIEGNSRCDDSNTPNTGGGSKPYYDIGAYEYKCSVTAPAPPTNLRIAN